MKYTSIFGCTYISCLVKYIFFHRISLCIVGDLQDKVTLKVLIFSVEHLETKRAKLDSHYQP